MRQVAEDTENGETSEHASECIERSDYGRISIDVVAKFVERRIHYNVSKSNGQREKALDDCCIPNLIVECIFGILDKLLCDFEW